MALCDVFGIAIAGRLSGQKQTSERATFHNIRSANIHPATADAKRTFAENDEVRKCQSRHSDRPPVTSDLPDERTFTKPVGMSQKCHERTYAAEQMTFLLDQLVGSAA
jgi:hypothetical protein